MGKKKRSNGLKVRRVTISNVRGLHARAAGKFARLANRFEAKITVVRNGEAVTASSIMGLMMLSAGPGADLELRAKGPAAKQALDALVALVENKFGEDDEEANKQAAAAQEGGVQG